MGKILVITSLYPDKINSVRGIFVQEQVNELRKKNEVRVFSTIISDGYSFEEDTENGVYQLNYCFPKFILSPIYYASYVKKKLNEVINSFQPDVIHIHDYKHIPEIFVLSFLLHFNKLQVFLILHNNKQIAENYGLMNYFYRLTLNVSLKKFSSIFVVSSKVKKIISPYCQSSKIKIIGNGVNPHFQKMDVDKQLLPKNQKVFNIISVGNLIKTKGFDFLIEAVSKINATNQDVHL